MSVFEELSVDDNLEVKNAPLSREEKAHISNWYTSMARVLLSQCAVSILKSVSSLEGNSVKIELCNGVTVLNLVHRNYIYIWIS